jgi:hypothetical protein
MTTNTPQEVDWIMFELEMKRCRGNKWLAKDVMEFLQRTQHLEQWYSAVLEVAPDGWAVVFFSHLTKDGSWLVTPVWSRGYFNARPPISQSLDERPLTREPCMIPNGRAFICYARGKIAFDPVQETEENLAEWQRMRALSKAIRASAVDAYEQAVDENEQSPLKLRAESVRLALLGHSVATCVEHVNAAEPDTVYVLK